MVRLPGVAPGHSPWRGDILLLNHSRKESKRAGSVLSHTPGPRHFNKEQTPLAIWFQIPTHGFTVALSVFRGTPPAKPLDCKIRLKSSGAHLWRPALIRAGGEPRLSRAALIFLPGDIV